MSIPHPAKLLFQHDDGWSRLLNKHPYIHVSATRGGLDIKHDVWCNLFFKKKQAEEIWHSAVIRLLRAHYRD
jgi:hypothetical protein